MFTNINECLNFIQSQHRTSTKNLKHMYQLCEIYGNPQKGLKYIHIAGTNGKGSIVAYLREILYLSGLKVGSFTSPYIIKFNERITFNKEFISDDLIIKYANEIISKYDYLEKNHIDKPGFFSFITLMCFMFFRDVKPDICLIEVGIGGLLDDTNVIEPLLSIISNVSYDHMNILGNSLYEIGTNKLGIVKKNVPLVTIENNEIHNLIVSTCKDKCSPLTIVNPIDIYDVKLSLGQTSFIYHDSQNEAYDITLNMSGKYQTENAAIVIEACNYLSKYFHITKENIINGLKNTFWPGRLEIIKKNPYVIFDGAHNIDGITRLHEFIKEFKDQYYITLVLAISANKEKKLMIAEIEKDVDEMFFTQFEYKRSEDAKILYDFSSHPNKILEYDYKKIIDKAFLCNDKKHMWIFAGSLYFISEIRSIKNN